MEQKTEQKGEICKGADDENTFRQGENRQHK